MNGGPEGGPVLSVRPQVFPMSREQEGLWLDDLVWDGPSRHLEAWVCRLTGQLDTAALEWAISQIVARHEVLRSRLTERDEQPVQIVTAPGPVRMGRLSCAPDALQAELRRIVDEPLDLDEAPIRPWLVRVPPDEFVLVVKIHHAVIDDWSLNIFQRELMHFYTARLLGRPPDLKPLPVQAGDFAAAQRAAEMRPADLAYWRERVRAAPRSCTIPPDRPATGDAPHRSGRHPFDIGPELGQAVRAAGRPLRTTTFTVFAAAMAVLLWQYGDADEVIFGTPVSLRGSAAVDGMIGLLTNLHPIRLAVSRGMSFRALVNAAKAEVLGAMQHRAVPYATIVRMARQGTAADAPPLCDAAMVVDDMSWEPFSLPEVTTQALHLPAGHTKFALHLALRASDDGGYQAAWNYDAEMFEAGTVARLARHFIALLDRCVAAPDESLGQISGDVAGVVRDQAQS
jgi:hypothetical protein